MADKEGIGRTEASDSPATETHEHAPAPGGAGIPKRIGHYHIKRVIASGGMGSVYEAVQEKPRRAVAVKLMRAGIASRSALRRFEYESQLLARLRHNGIAQVYDAGTHRDGDVPVPYFVMEYIVGARPITDYVRDKKLGSRERMKLFIHVCEAVHHGHQKGIVHRDLKPSNILVDSSGQVKIIDFGVARSTDSDMAVTTLQTDVGQLIGTLQYMSPEQCAADPHDIDTRSDVYALGVILYEMLCERLPYKVKSNALHEATRVIREEEPTRLSSYKKTLRGDVETIALKALEKDRDRRYQSALELATDIDRYLNNQPIAARPAGAMYQFRKLVARHKAPFVFVAVLFLVVGAFGIWMSLLYAGAESLRQDAVQAREEAETSRDEAEEVVTFLTDMLSAADPKKGGKEVTVREVVDKAAERVGREFSNSPLIEARLRRAIGWTYRGLGLFNAARDHLSEAVAIYTRVLGPSHPRTLGAMANHAVVLGGQGDFGKAEAVQRRTLETQRRVLGEEHPDTLASMNNLAISLRAQGRYEDAAALHRQALEIKRRILGEEHPDTLSSMNNLAISLQSQGRHAEAEALHRRTLEIRRRVLGEEHPDTLVSMNNLANRLHDQGRYAEAEALHRQALEIQRRVLGEKHPDTLASMNNLAISLYNRGRYAEAETLQRQTLEIQRRVLGAEHPTTLKSMNNLAGSLYRQGRYDDAEALYRQTLEIRRHVLGAAHPALAEPMLNLAETLEQLQRWSEAQRLCEQAGSIWAGRLPPGHFVLQYNDNVMGGILAGLGRFAEAESLLCESYGALKDDSRISSVEKDMLQRFVRLYEVWNAAEPGKGHDVQAAEWRAKLEAKATLPQSDEATRGGCGQD